MTIKRSNSGVKPLGGHRRCQSCGQFDYMKIRDSIGVVHGPRYFACFRCQPSMCVSDNDPNSRWALGSDMGDLNYHILDEVDEVEEVSEDAVLRIDDIEELETA